MGLLVNGEWKDQWYDTSESGGRFVRSTAKFRDWITLDGSDPQHGIEGAKGYPAAKDRYHLYVSYACPWAHRALILRALKGLDDMIDVSVVHPDMLKDGWTFADDRPGATGDTLFGLPFLRDIYTKAKPDVSGRVTVPVLWDKETESIVSNESSEIIRMFNSAFDGLGAKEGDYWPEALREEIEEVNARVYEDVNNGVYKAGFATSQHAYDEAVEALFEAMTWLETRLEGRDWLVGDAMTEADIRLFTTMVRFDSVYHGHFKCNRRKLTEMPNLWLHTRRIFNMDAVRPTVRLDHIVRHYHYSHETINPYRIVPIGPDIDWSLPDHERSEAA